MFGQQGTAICDIAALRCCPSSCILLPTLHSGVLIIEWFDLLQHSSCIGYIQYFVRLLLYSPLHCTRYPIHIY